MVQLFYFFFYLRHDGLLLPWQPVFYPERSEGSLERSEGSLERSKGSQERNEGSLERSEGSLERSERSHPLAGFVA